MRSLSKDKITTPKIYYGWAVWAMALKLWEFVSLTQTAVKGSNLLINTGLLWFDWLRQPCCSRFKRAVIFQMVLFFSPSSETLRSYVNLMDYLILINLSQVTVLGILITQSIWILGYEVITGTKICWENFSAQECFQL